MITMNKLNDNELFENTTISENDDYNIPFFSITIVIIMIGACFFGF